MSDNKFIERLKGKETAKSVLEVKNQATKLSFANMPQGTSNAIDVFSDHRGNATAVLNGTTNWKVSNSELLLADTVFGDGQDFTSTYTVIGTGLWVNASYTFPSTGDQKHPVAAVFNPSTKWVLKVCGDNLIVDGGSTVDFTMLIKIGTANVYSKNFTIRESAGQFSKEFVIDFGEANSDIVKASGLSTLTVQLLCGTPNASARIYNGMTVLTCLQRKVDASAVSSSFANVEEVMHDGIFPSDFFDNAEFMEGLVDGAQVFPIFVRDGDQMIFSGWRDNSFKKYVFSLTAGQTVLQFDENIEEKDINLYWNGQLITQSGNWNPSGDTITLSFEPEENDIIVVTTNPKFAVVNYVSLEQHNTDPDAHDAEFETKATKVTVRRW